MSYLSKAKAIQKKLDQGYQVVRFGRKKSKRILSPEERRKLHHDLEAIVKAHSARNTVPPPKWGKEKHN